LSDFGFASWQTFENARETSNLLIELYYSHSTPNGEEPKMSGRQKYDLKLLGKTTRQQW
jgi:hypothetical protein